MAIFIAPRWGDLTLTHPQTPRTLSENRSLTHKARSLSLLLLSQSLALFLSLSYKHAQQSSSSAMTKGDAESREGDIWPPCRSPVVYGERRGKAARRTEAPRAENTGSTKPTERFLHPSGPTSPEASVQYAEKTSGLIIAMIRSAVTWSHGCNCIISASLNLGIATHGYKCVRKRGKKAFSAIEKHTNRS